MGKKKEKSKKVVSIKTLAKEYSEKRLSKSTKTERLFRNLLTQARIVYKREKIVYNSSTFYLIDFFIPSKNLCIELDGGYHNEPEQVEKDQKRDAFLAHRGYNIWRMTNDEASVLSVDSIKEKINSFSYEDKKRIWVLPTVEEPINRNFRSKFEKSKKKRKNRFKPHKPIVKPESPFVSKEKALENKRLRELKLIPK